jgi:hypothetical protein
VAELASCPLELLAPWTMQLVASDREAFGEFFFEKASLTMELPKRHATPLYGQPFRTTT